MSFDAEFETKRRIMVEQEIMAQAAMARMRSKMEEGVEQQIKMQKESQIKSN